MTHEYKDYRESMGFPCLLIRVNIACCSTPGPPTFVYGMPEHLELTWMMWTFWYCRMDIAIIRAACITFLQ